MHREHKGASAPTPILPCLPGKVAFSQQEELVLDTHAALLPSESAVGPGSFCYWARGPSQSVPGGNSQLWNPVLRTRLLQTWSYTTPSFPPGGSAPFHPVLLAAGTYCISGALSFSHALWGSAAPSAPCLLGTQFTPAQGARSVWFPFCHFRLLLLPSSHSHSSSPVSIHNSASVRPLLLPLWVRLWNARGSSSIPRA